MQQEFYRRKIRELNDQRLIDLLKLRNKENHEILQYAIEEARKRNILIEEVDPEASGVQETGGNDKSKLDRWNWAAFLLAPFWALSNRLDWWAVLTVVPLVNIPVIFYLGFKGNKIAFDKSSIVSIDDFMAIQRHWNTWALRIFWISFALGIVWLVSYMSL